MEEAPDPVKFRESATKVLTEGLPAFLFDSLFYIRGTNSYVQAIGGDTDLSSNIHALRPALTNQARPGEEANREERIQRWVREFWLATAPMCGSTPYRQTLEHLKQMPSFEERWRNLGSQFTEDAHQPAFWPYFFTRGDIGTFRVYTSSIFFPPFYYLREYVPVDEQAWERLKEVRSHGEPVVQFAPEHHWAAPRLEAVAGGA